MAAPSTRNIIPLLQITPVNVSAVIAWIRG